MAVRLSPARGRDYGQEALEAVLSGLRIVGVILLLTWLASQWGGS